MAAENKKRTRLSPEVRRAHLLEAAAAIIRQHGLSGFTMEALAKEAGVSNPLVYKYFATRRDLLQALLESEFDHYHEDLQERLIAADSVRDVVRIFVAKNFEEVDRGSVAQVLQRQPDLQPGIREKQKREERWAARFLVARLAQNYGLTRAQAAHIAFMGSGASIGTAERIDRLELDRDELIEATVEFIVAGIEAYGASGG